MKSEYLDSLTDTLDLLIIGGYYGEGRRTQGVSYDWNDHISVFLMGVAKTINKDNPKNSVVLPLVKVGTGYSQEQLEILRQRLKYNWKKYDSRMPPSIFGNWTPGMSERPDVYIDNPSESIVLELKAAELVPTETFAAKMTLRFPRVVNIRYDKCWEDAMKFEEILKFYGDLQNNLLNKDKRKLDDFANEELDLVKEKKRKKVDKFTKILETFRDTDTNNITKVSNLFKGMEFLVLTLDDNLINHTQKKKALECSIVEQGGIKVQNFLPSTTHVIASKLDVRGQNILKTNDINIYNPKWVYDSIRCNKLMTISPLYLTYANRETKKQFVYTIDKFNDNYYEDLTPESLAELFLSMKEYEKDEDFNFVMQEIKKEYSESEWVKNIKL